MSSEDSDYSSDHVDEVSDYHSAETAIHLIFDSLDPSRLIQNPEDIFTPRSEEFFQQPLNSSEHDQLCLVMDKFQELYRSIQTLYVNSIRQKLEQKTLRRRDVFSIVNTWFEQMPDFSEFQATFLNEKTLPLFSERLIAHQQCVEDVKKLADSLRFNEESESESSDTDEEVKKPPPRRRSRQQNQPIAPKPKFKPKRVGPT